jgi:hypothetical protein
MVTRIHPFWIRASPDAVIPDLVITGPAGRRVT